MHKLEFPMSKFERMIFDALLSRTEGQVRLAIVESPVAELFTPQELHDLSPLIDHSLSMFERAGIVEHVSEGWNWNWSESEYRLSPHARELSEHRRSTPGTLESVGASA
jgi:hypothetical protein